MKKILFVLLLCSVATAQEIPKWQVNLTPVQDEEILGISVFQGINTFLAPDKIGDGEAQDCRDFLINDGNLVRRPGFWKYEDNSFDTLSGIIGMTWYNGEIIKVASGGKISIGLDTVKFTFEMYSDEDLIIEWFPDGESHYSLLWNLTGTQWSCSGPGQSRICTDPLDATPQNIEDQYGLTMPSITQLSTSDVIDSIQGKFIAAIPAFGEGNAKLRMIITSGSTADTSSQFSVVYTPTTFSYTWATNPADDGAWARSDLENLKLAVLCDSIPAGGGDCVAVGKLWIKGYGNRASYISQSIPVINYPVYFAPFEDQLVIATRWDVPTKYKNAQLDTLGDIIWGNFTEYVKADSSNIYDSSQSFGIYDLNSAFLQDLDTGWVVPIISNSTHRCSIEYTLPYNDSALSKYKIFCRPDRTEDLDTGTVTSATESTLVHTGAFTANAYNNNTYYAQITAGVGLGQVNHIWSNTANTLTFRHHWEVKPTSASKYAIWQAVMPRAPIAYWQGCLFACGVYQKNRVYFSTKVDPEYFFIDYYLDAPGSRNDSILALGASQYLTDQSSDELKGLWVFQAHTISMVSGTYPNFTLNALADNISFIAPKSLVFIGDTPFYLGYDGVYAGIKKISQKVKRFIDRMNRAQAYLSAGGYYDGHYYLSIPDSASDVPNLTLVYNPETDQWTTFSYGFTDFLTVLSDSLRFYMASFTSPHIYQYGGVSDTGYAFIPYWQSKQFEFDPVWVQIFRGFVSYDVDYDTGTVKLRVYEKNVVGDSLDFYGSGWDDSTEYFGDGLINNSFFLEITQGSNLDTLRVNKCGIWFNKKGVR